VPFLQCLRSVGRNSCGNSLASVSGEWQVTASVTNESSVQLHLFNALLRRANHGSLFVKHHPLGRKRAREELNIYRNHPSWENCYKPLTLNIFHGSAGYLRERDWMTWRQSTEPQTVTARNSCDFCCNDWPTHIMSYLISDLFLHSWIQTWQFKSHKCPGGSG